MEEQEPRISVSEPHPKRLRSQASIQGAPVAPRGEAGVCFNFKNRGKCFRGSTCRYSHETDTQQLIGHVRLPHYSNIHPSRYSLFSSLNEFSVGSPAAHVFSNSLQSAPDAVANIFSNSVQSAFDSVPAISAVNDILSGFIQSSPQVVSVVPPTADIFSISANSVSDVVPVISPSIEVLPISNHFSGSLQFIAEALSSLPPSSMTATAEASFSPATLDRLPGAPTAAFKESLAQLMACQIWLMVLVPLSKLL
jgi:hypothetical protein